MRSALIHSGQKSTDPTHSLISRQKRVIEKVATHTQTLTFSLSFGRCLCNAFCTIMWQLASPCVRVSVMLSTSHSSTSRPRKTAQCDIRRLIFTFKQVQSIDYHRTIKKFIHKIHNQSNNKVNKPKL